MDMYVAVRALENTVYIACCNRIGKDKSLDFFGHTKILDPTGRIISEIKGEVEGYTYASLDYGRINKLKEMDIQCFQKDDLNCIKVFVNNIKGYAHN